MKNVLSAIFDSDPAAQRVRKRYSVGTVEAIQGPNVLVDVGAVLPDGTAVKMTIPIATGFRPVVGQGVAIAYANDDLNAPYATVLGDAVSVDTMEMGRTALIVPFYVNSVAENTVATTVQAITKNLYERALKITGVAISAQGAVGSPTVDVYVGASSVLTGPVTLAAVRTVYAGTIYTAFIAADADISIRCATGAGESISGLTVHLMCTAATP